LFGLSISAELEVQGAAGNHADPDLKGLEVWFNKAAFPIDPYPEVL